MESVAAYKFLRKILTSQWDPRVIAIINASNGGELGAWCKIQVLYTYMTRLSSPRWPFSLAGLTFTLLLDTFLPFYVLLPSIVTPPLHHPFWRLPQTLAPRSDACAPCYATRCKCRFKLVFSRKSVKIHSDNGDLLLAINLIVTVVVS